MQQEKLKIIVTHLPPKLPEDVFMKSIAQYKDNINYVRYSHGVAYLSFTNTQSLLQFTTHYNGWLFKSATGEKHTAQVEYAPYQRVPLESRPDHREGSIVTDQVYLKFMEDLSKLTVGQSPLYMNTELYDFVQTKQDPTKTPLLEYLKTVPHKLAVPAKVTSIKKKPQTQSDKPSKSARKRKNKKQKAKELQQLQEQSLSKAVAFSSNSFPALGTNAPVASTATEVLVMQDKPQLVQQKRPEQQNASTRGAGRGQRGQRARGSGRGRGGQQRLQQQSSNS